MGIPNLSTLCLGQFALDRRFIHPRLPVRLRRDMEKIQKQAFDEGIPFILNLKKEKNIQSLLKLCEISHVIDPRLTKKMISIIESIRQMNYIRIHCQQNPVMEAINGSQRTLEAAKYFYYISQRYENYNHTFNRFQVSELYLCVVRGFVDGATFFLTSERNINFQDPDGINQTSLMVAIKADNIEMVELILQRRDIDFSLKDIYGQTA